VKEGQKQGLKALMEQRPWILGVSLLAAVGSIVLAASGTFLSMRKPDLVIKGPGVTRETLLSEYFPGLKGTPGDTELYVMDGAEPGGNLLVLGGTHPNEPGASMTAVLLVESARVARGRVFVIPFLAKSGFTHNDPGDGSPQRFTIKTAGGDRTFKYGSRAINPVDSWPDPEVYVHTPSGQILSGEETRNVNRSFPGKPEGSLGERIAYGVVQLINKEAIDLTIDLHEAMPEYPNINVIVAHQRALALGASAQVDLMIQGIQIAISPSPPRLHGLTHRELGDATKTLATLMETPNITFGRLRAQTTERTILEGKDPFYVWGAKLGRLFVPFDEKGWPLELRVARHTTGVKALADSLGYMAPERTISLEVPTYDDIISKGVGAFLNPP
jgi:hypothetical protein